MSLTCEFAVKMSFQPSLSKSTMPTLQPLVAFVNLLSSLGNVASRKLARPELRKSGKDSPASAV